MWHICLNTLKYYIYLQDQNICDSCYDNEVIVTQWRTIWDFFFPKFTVLVLCAITVEVGKLKIPATRLTANYTAFFPYKLKSFSKKRVT